MRLSRIGALVLLTATLIACSFGGGNNDPDTSRFEQKCENHPEYKMCQGGAPQP